MNFDQFYFLFVTGCVLVVVLSGIVVAIRQRAANGEPVARPIVHALCAQCSPDGDYYHAIVNLFPVGTRLVCTQCGKGYP
jgi:hypothetical protein